MCSPASRYIVARENNVVRVDFSREPDPPAPRFPGAGAMRDGGGYESGDNLVPPVRSRTAYACEMNLVLR